jgi:hypothetical protein
MPQQPPTVRNQVFVSYSHADEEFLKRLRVHLGLLERRNIKIWTDKDIEPGMKWRDEIRDALATTKVAVLLISTDFLSSDFITKQELPPLLAAASSEGVRILPVIVKPSAFDTCDIEIEPLTCYQAVNMGRPLVKLKDDAEREEEFVRILQIIRKTMEGAPRSSPAAPAGAPPSAPEDAEPPLDEPSGDDAVPDDEQLCADLEAMFDDPTAQALSIQAVTEHDATELMLVTEGQDGTILLELLTNDELPPEITLGRDAQRHLVEQLGFNRPEIRGDRFWTIFGADGEEIDFAEVTALIFAVLSDIFGIPSEEVGVGWLVLEQ